MFDSNNKIKSVTFETNDNKSFDDVKVEYDPEISGEENTPNVKYDYYQVKFHVLLSPHFTLQDLMDPKFTGATKYSILQKLKTAVLDDYGDSRYHLLSSWDIKPDDVLGKLIDANGAFIIDKLFDDRKRSKMARARTELMDHLDLSDEEDLKKILKSFRLKRAKDYNLTYEEFNVRLKAAKLKTIDKSQLINPYSTLYDSLLSRNQKEFTKDVLIRILLKNNLFDDIPAPNIKWYESVHKLISKLEVMMMQDMKVYYTRKGEFLDLTDYVDIFNEIERKMAFPVPHYLFPKTKKLKRVCNHLFSLIPLPLESVRSKKIVDLDFELNSIIIDIKNELTGF